MRIKIALLLAGLITLAGLAAAPAQADPAPAKAGCVAGADQAVCEVPGSKVVMAASASDCWNMSDRLCLFTGSGYGGTMNSYRSIGGSAAGYRLQPVMYNHVRSVINNTATGWWLHDQGDCNGGTRIYISPYQSYAWLTIYQVNGDWWYDRISSVTWLNNGTYC